MTSGDRFSHFTHTLDRLYPSNYAFDRRLMTFSIATCESDTVNQRNIHAQNLYAIPMLIPQIILDTNIVVAGLRSKQGSAFRLLTLVGTGCFDIHLSVPLVLEY